MTFATFDPRDYECYDGLVVPEDVVIPTTDLAAWTHYPNESWVYNRMELARKLGHRCGPMEMVPSEWPVFLKPIYNFRGGGFGAQVIRSPEAFFQQGHCSTGLFWCEVFRGDHLSFDLVLQQGEVVFDHTFSGRPIGDGMFDQWVTVEPPPDVLKTVVSWAQDALPEYTGAVNVETIGGRIIEAHLRMGDIDRCGSLEWMQALVDLYAGKEWRDLEVEPFDVMCVFGNYCYGYDFDEDFLDELEEAAITVSVEDRDVMPAGGHRILAFSIASGKDGAYWRDRALKSCDLPPIEIGAPLPD